VNTHEGLASVVSTDSDISASAGVNAVACVIAIAWVPANASI
jgi:hypothetical protein